MSVHACTHYKCPCSYEDITAMVTIGEGKYYSLGLDLVTLATLSAMEIEQFVNDIQRLLLRLLTFPLVTVAAINGQLTHITAPRE